MRVLAVLLAGLGTSGAAWAATVRVPDDAPDLASAVALAAEGDTIELGEGTWAGVARIDKALLVQGAPGATVVLTSEGAAILQVQGVAVTVQDLQLRPSGARAITATDAELSVVDVTIEGGSEPELGGAVAVRGGSARFERVTLTDNRSGDGYGGQIYALDAEITLVDGSITGGRAERGGALYVDGGTLSIRGTRLQGNAARRDDDRGLGGAIATERAEVRIEGASFIDNRVNDGQGGHISVFLGTLDIRGTRFSGTPGSPSATQYFGGGVAAYDAPLLIEDCTFQDLSVEHTGEEGTFGYGGALMIYGASGADFTVRDSVFSGNTVTAFGGGIRIDVGSGTLERNTFQGNDADYGGAIHIASPDRVTVLDSTFTANHGRFAGAIRWRPPSSGATSSELELRGNAFVDNTADRYGGVMYARAAGTLVAADNTFDGNTSELGGALMLWQIRDVDLVRNRFCHNVVEGGTGPDGGAVASYLAGRGTYFVDNNVFIGNRATGWGGAISLLQDGDVDLRHNTFLANAAGDGAAVGIRGASEAPVVARLQDSLLAFNTGAEAVSGTSVARLGLDRSAFFANAEGDVEPKLGELGPDNLTTDPGLLAFSDDGDCGNDVPYPRWDSPLVDAGDADGTDLDGSRSEVGASGGQRADPALWLDQDQDGSPVLWDCDDADPARGHDSDEVPYDGIDQDCDGADLIDVDGDGFAGGADGPDCADDDAAINPDAEDVPDDGIDQDCSGGDATSDTGEPGDTDGGPSGADPGGCGCATSSPVGLGGSLLLALLGLRRSRRRVSTARVR